ncbi:TetR/AcrR family transcriptional regulator [Streptomyces sp. TRM 70361]|uniref:TetR/AcrR family transcriptional regulator n=1 Tax=Streptomyces sp. TRM 70361 TaxID=3116553 RepID=UPI002E7BD657|nr:TetR/AcrR family transcriptional regulator [Streptomyces sp. TRM 70361]MEE1939712.1 TetR/AcrR family transcriptional regulator [Streptomyces sp. TRM 70361]
MPTEDTRTRLVAHATSLFHREGFHAVGVDRLAAELGISKKTLYKQFRSKDALLAEVLDRCDDMAVRDFPDESDDASPQERLLGVFDAQRAYCEAPEFSGCFFVNIATEFRDPSHPAVRQACFHKSQLHAYVRRQAEIAGALDPEAVAEQLVVLHTGAADYALLTGRYPAAVRGAVEALLDAWGVR